MPSPRINVVKYLLSGAIFCTVLVSRAPAQKLEWIEPSLIGLPSARCCAPIVYDAAMGATLLFGGRTYTTTFGDTWAFSKATGWKQLAPAVSPPPLSNAGLRTIRRQERSYFSAVPWAATLTRTKRGRGTG
jgi:hypothetical protein